MCDEYTAAEALADRDSKPGGSATLSGIDGTASDTAAPSAAGPLMEAATEVRTPDGACDAFFVHPASGRHPGIVFWPDALGLRDATKAMARRLAGEGFAVLAVNPYYRNVRAPLDIDFAAMLTPEGRAKVVPYMPALTPEAISRDGAAYVAFLDAQPAVDTARGVGVQGYCFAGPFAVRTAVAVPARVKAAATFHGGGLVGDTPDSPHNLLGSTQAAFLFAIARNDDARSPLDKDELRAAAEGAGRLAEIEVYPADHGWCVPDAPSFDHGEADRAWQRLLALYGEL